jgi:hypothetical protein
MFSRPYFDILTPFANLSFLVGTHKKIGKKEG